MTWKDSLSTELHFDQRPQRVISLVPSITEWLIDMGVEVVGRTKFCVHPEEKVADIPVIGGTKNFRFDTIERLTPDLIIGNKEENYKEGIQRLRESNPVWMTVINSFSDAIDCFDQLSDCLAIAARWQEKRTLLLERYEGLKKEKSGSVIYLIWLDPWMAVGQQTYVNSFLEATGYENRIKLDRYPTLTIEEIKKQAPDYLFLSSEPFPFKQQHVEQLHAQLPNTTVRLVNGEYYSWYGTRLLKLEDDQIKER